MSITIICTGQSEQPAAGNCSAAAFETAFQAELEAPMVPYTGRRLDCAGRNVYIGEGRLARDTAEKYLLPCELITEPLLNEIPLRAFTETEKAYSRETCLRKAAVQRKRGDPLQPESRDAVLRRCEQLIRRIERENCILVTYPLFLTEFLEQLRKDGFVIQRTGLLKIQPLERFVISRKEEHCGGCQHNCFLVNPGCGVGRDKALRKSRQSK